VTDSPESSATSLTDLPVDQRTALLAAAPNFRDAGGLDAGRGRDLRSGTFFRTGQLVAMDAAAQAALTSLGIARVFDLRTEAERVGGPDTLPLHVELVIADVLADTPHSGATAVAALGNSRGRGFPVDEIDAVIGGGRAKDLMIDTYRDFIQLPSANAAYRALVSSVIHDSGAVAFHCTAGKDRTGWAAALLQMVAGVDETAVMADYLASNARTAAQYGPVVDAFGAAGGDAAALRCRVDVDEDDLEAASRR
jgi:protein-tyrosine phosphatase